LRLEDQRNDQAPSKNPEECKVRSIGKPIRQLRTGRRFGDGHEIRRQTAVKTDFPSGFVFHGDAFGHRQRKDLVAIDAGQIQGRRRCSHLTKRRKEKRIDQCPIIEDGIEIPADLENGVQVEYLALELTVGFSQLTDLDVDGGTSISTARRDLSFAFSFCFKNRLA